MSWVLLNRFHPKGISSLTLRAKVEMSEVVHTPQLRFPEFSGAWNTHSIGKIGTFFSGGTPASSNKDYYSGTIPFIGSGKISSESVKQHITQEALDSSSAKIVNEGDLLYALYGATSGAVALSKINGAINQAVLCIRTNENKFFLKTWLEKNKERILGTYLQGGQGNLSAQIVKSLKLNLPTKPEQQKIAAFLTAVDNKIEQLSKKQALLGEYKKGLMQQIFSQAIRFKANDDSEFPDWEEKKLGDVCKLQGGYAFKSAEFQKHGIPIIRISNISNNNDFIDNRNLVYYNEIKNSDKFIIKNGDLIVAMSGATTGKSSIYNLIEDAYLNQRVGLFKANNSLLDYGFLIQIVFSYIFATQLDSVLVAGAQPNVSSKDIEGFEISLPSKIEQNKIANFLSSIDSKIEQVGKQLDESKQFKKALLQQMFV
jgi:type I restriction enzyme S subunit